MSNSAKMSARQRIESLVDANSFVEIGALVTKRNTDFNMQEKQCQLMVSYRLWSDQLRTGICLQPGCDRDEWFCRRNARKEDCPSL